MSVTEKPRVCWRASFTNGHAIQFFAEDDIKSAKKWLRKHFRTKRLKNGTEVRRYNPKDNA